MNIEKKISYLIFFTFLANPIFAYTPPPQGLYAGVIVGGSSENSISAPFVRPLAEIIAKRDSRIGQKVKSLIEERTKKITYTLDYTLLGLVGGQLGYRWNRFRLEGELFYNAAPYNNLIFDNGNRQINIGSSSNENNYIAGNTFTLSGLLNVYVDLLPSVVFDSSISPFVGIGGGFASVQNNLDIFLNGDEITKFNLATTQYSSAGQVIVGVHYFLDEVSNVGLDYRYFSTGNLKTQYPDNVESYRVKISSINITYNGSFNFG
jgi:opacity protein-like surface antigen